MPLPRDPFTLLAVRPVKVHPDCHVVIDGSYYSAPYSYVGQILEAYIGERIVQLFCAEKLLCTHERALQPGEHHTRCEHYPAEMAEFLQRTPTYCRQLAAEIGPATRQVVQTLLDDRPLDRLRSVQAILRLERSVGSCRLEAACARAVCFGDGTYRRIKQILNAALDCEPLPDQALDPARRPVAAHPYVFARSSVEFFAPPEVLEEVSA